MRKWLRYQGLDFLDFLRSGETDIHPSNRAATRGLKYSDGPHLKENGGGFAFIDAPEGYEIELIQPAKEQTTDQYG